MNKASFVSGSLRRFMSPYLAALAVCVLLAPSAANATPYVVTLKQQGPNVVAVGSGAFDLTGLMFGGATISVPSGLAPADYAYVFTGPGASALGIDTYTGAITGPASFGSGNYKAASSGSGSVVEFLGTFFAGYGGPDLWLPSGYVSENALSSSATWANATFASLGVTPGTYTWTWGTGADQSFTLDVVKPVGVPEPAALGMFGFGMLLIGACASLRRRVG